MITNNTTPATDLFGDSYGRDNHAWVLPVIKKACSVLSSFHEEGEAENYDGFGWTIKLSEKGRISIGDAGINNDTHVEVAVIGNDGKFVRGDLEIFSLRVDTDAKLFSAIFRAYGILEYERELR